MPDRSRAAELAIAHGVIDLAANDEPPNRRLDGDPVAILRAQLAQIVRIDQHGAIRIVATPRRIAKDLVGIEHAATTGRQHEWELLWRPRGLRIEMPQPIQHLRNDESYFAIRVADECPD